VFVQPDAFLINITPWNWEICNSYRNFGIPADADHPTLAEGDLFLVRRARIKACGCVAVWELGEDKRVDPQTPIRWPDAVQNGGDVRYGWVQRFREIVAFRQVFSEGFGGVTGGGFSEKIGMSPRKLWGTLFRIDRDFRRYVSSLIEEKKTEIPPDVQQALLAAVGT
jgi:hypothetical protein